MLQGGLFDFPLAISFCHGKCSGASMSYILLIDDYRVVSAGNDRQNS